MCATFKNFEWKTSLLVRKPVLLKFKRTRSKLLSKKTDQGAVVQLCAEAEQIASDHSVPQKNNSQMNFTTYCYPESAAWTIHLQIGRNASQARWRASCRDALQTCSIQLAYFCVQNIYPATRLEGYALERTVTDCIGLNECTWVVNNSSTEHDRDTKLFGLKESLQCIDSSLGIQSVKNGLH